MKISIIFQLLQIIYFIFSCAGSTVFKINLKTEAGTYIKEFVHGDFGRTQPNLSAILGDIPIDVLALDVTVSF